MALVKCPECGKENVSDQAITCPECGYVFKKTKNIEIPPKVLLGFSIIYTICALVYAHEYIWCFESVAFIFLGLVVNLTIFIKERNSKFFSNLFMIGIYAIGTFIFAFSYNISRLDLDFIDGMFSSYIYSDSLGVVLAIYQICAMISVIFIILKMFVPNFESNIVVAGIFVSAVMGFVFNMYDKIHLERTYGHGGDFYIWLALTSLLWFLFFVVYTLSIPNSIQEEQEND